MLGSIRNYIITKSERAQENLNKGREGIRYSEMESFRPQGYNILANKYRNELLARQNKFPLSRFLSPEPHVRSRQIDRMVSEYTKKLTYRMKYGSENAQLKQNWKTLLNKCWVRLGKIIIK